MVHSRTRRSVPFVAILLAAQLILMVPGSLGGGQSGTVHAAFGGLGAILPITGEITDLTVESLRRRVELARNKGVDLIVFELDTPGGLVTSSIAIADLIKGMTDTKTVAWVNPNAHSGGSIVAVAADEIVMARSSRMGDSQVIALGPEGASAIPEELQPKAYTPVLKEFAASARLNGYDLVLSEAFVLPDREVWWIENIETGKRRFVLREEKLKLLGEETAESEDADDASESKEASAPAKWKLVESYFDVLTKQEVETYQPIVPSTQLLEMSAAEAQAWGFSKAVVANTDELMARYELDKTIRIAPNWSESLAFWMTSIYVRGFLMVIILLGAYVEFHTPGVGVPGLVALICLGIMVGAPYLTGLASVWEIALILLGILLMVLEIFVVPGFGFVGIGGLVCFFVGLLATFVPEEPGQPYPIVLPTLPQTIHAVQVAIITMTAAMMTSLLGVLMLRRVLPQTTLFRRLAPANPTLAGVRMEDPYKGAVRVGDVGVAEGPLHPSGKARFGTVLVDVVSQGEYVAADARIEVIEQRGNRVVVRAIV